MLDALGYETLDELIDTVVPEQIRLRQLNESQEEFISIVSHELRTPLTTVIGTLRLLSAGPPMGPAERQEMLEMADRQARRLRVLIEQLLLAAQSDNGRASFLSAAVERVEADAARLLVEAATEARAGTCGDRVQVRCDRSLPVRTAPDVVLQILGNLVDNACKYAPEDSPVWLSGERDGLDLLSPDDYLWAADQLLGHLRRLTVHFLRRFWITTAAVAAILAAALVVVVVVRAASAVVAAVLAAAGAIGITWKGAASGLGRVLTQAQRPLWDSELDVAVANAVTWLPRERRTADRTATPADAGGTDELSRR